LNVGDVAENSAITGAAHLHKRRGAAGASANVISFNLLRETLHHNRSNHVKKRGVTGAFTSNDAHSMAWQQILFHRFELAHRRIEIHNL